MCSLRMAAKLLPALFLCPFGCPWPLMSVATGAETLDQIVVTARKRQENLQDIPLSVTAFSEEDIERAAFRNLDDIAAFTPGLETNSTYSDRAGRLISDIRMRGIEGGARVSGATTSLFIDGIYALQAAQSFALVDLERIEIIKGPQSAIFARNSFAGAINYITSNPSLEAFSGKLLVDAGQYSQYDVSGRIDIPVIQDKLAARIGGRFYHKGEMFTATDGGALGIESSESIFLTLYAEPSDRLSLKFRAYYQEDDDGPPAVAGLRGIDFDTCTGTSRPGFDEEGNPVTLHPINFICGIVPNPGEPGAPRVDTNTSMFPRFFSDEHANVLIENLVPEGDGVISGVPDLRAMGLKREMTRISLTGEYTFDNGLTATATAAYNDNVASNLRDFDEHIIESWWVSNPQSGTDKSFDIRLVSAQDRRLRWLGGFTLYTQEFLMSAEDGWLVHVCGNFAGRNDPTGAHGDFCDFPFVGTSGTDGGDFVDVWGVYGSLSFDVTDELTFDVEGRYQEDERGDGVSDFSHTYTDFVPRLTLTYQPTDNITAYGLYTEGLLPGSVNQPILSCSDVPYSQPFISPVTGLPSTSSECEQFREQLGEFATPVTASQKLESFEVGVKTSWANGRILSTVALYHQDWINRASGVPVRIVRDSDGDTIPDEGERSVAASVPGNAVYKGVELETWIRPTENWDVGVAISYNDNEFKKLSVPGRDSIVLNYGTPNMKGNRAGRFPEWSGSLSATYTRPIDAGWTIYSRGDIKYQGEAVTGDTNLALVDDYAVVDVRLGVENEALRLELYVKNLFDEDKWAGGREHSDFTFPFGTADELALSLIPLDKRTLGLRASYIF